MLRALTLALVIALNALAQSGSSIHVLSEFRRMDFNGAIAEPDRGGKPREILSPAMVRNAWHSYHIVVDVPEKRDYALYIEQNPARRFRMNLYRAYPEDDGMRERLEPKPLHTGGRGGRPADVYLLDVFVPHDAPAGRVRVEAQIHDGHAWVIYPMEVRVFAAIVPPLKNNNIRLPSAKAPVSELARATLKEYLCQQPAQPGPALAFSLRQLVRRNALQDAALAQLLEKKLGREMLLAKLPHSMEICAPDPPGSPNGTEWYLRVRDFLFREASR
ncbi:MAG: hypothetical protein SFV51_31545 [Bryobacteraceae bacterium]|nr:hypothetical protein [Bryobacteraceae bacterium]